jgi:hypothetical protein
MIACEVGDSLTQPLTQETGICVDCLLLQFGMVVNICAGS